MWPSGLRPRGRTGWVARPGRDTGPRDAAGRPRAAQHPTGFAAILAAAMIKHEGIPAASSVVGTPTVTDVYITHFKGAKGGRRFLRDVKRRPNDIAATYMGETVLANNRSVFYKNGDLTRPRTFQEVYDYFTSRLDKFEHHVSLVESYPVLATAPPEVPDEILLNPVSVADASSGTKPLTTASFIPSNIGLLRINNG